MQTVQAYPVWQQTFAAAQPRSGWLAYLRGFTVTAWLFSLTLNWWWITDWFAMQELFQQGDIKSNYYYGFAIALVGHLTLGLHAWLTVPFRLLSDWTGRLMGVFLGLMLLLSPISAVPRSSALYAAATAVAVAILSLFWASNYRVLQRVLVATSLALFGWLLILLAKNGLTDGLGGIIGGVNRNITGTAALAAMICGLFTYKQNIRWGVIAAAVFFVAIVSSRGSLVGMTAFFAVYFACYKGTVKAAGYALGCLLLAFIAMLVSPDIRHVVLEDIFRLHDSARGMGSGFTGRVGMWEQGLKMFWKQPVFGYGFRATTHARGVGFGGVHSAYIKILLEGGLVGGFLLIAANVNEIIARLRLVLRLRTVRPNELPGIDLVETFRVNVLTCATLCLISTIWVYDQYYVNLGSPISVVYFLMLFSPRYITTQGVAFRS
jgi:O-antigen ligase